MGKVRFSGWYIRDIRIGGGDVGKKKSNFFKGNKKKKKKLNMGKEKSDWKRKRGKQTTTNLGA